MDAMCPESLPRDLKYLKGLRPATRYRIMNQLGEFSSQNERVAYSSATEEDQSRALLRALVRHDGGPVMESWNRMTKKQLIEALIEMKLELDRRPFKSKFDELSDEAQRLRCRNTELQHRGDKLDQELNELKAAHNLEREAHRALVHVVNRLY